VHSTSAEGVLVFGSDVVLRRAVRDRYAASFRYLESVSAKVSLGEIWHPNIQSDGTQSREIS
jgi:hypothetical protein